ncbi:MAG: DUF2007 domain-containing protein [Sediminicola sp.]|tara:strand:+ start:53219 stop:53452 length:234 start_codon:yes stop_codon:yes gene_type:complete
MKSGKKYINIYTGSMVSVILLKGILEAQGIGTITKDGNESGRLAGFSGGSYGGVQLFVMEADRESALPLVNEFEGKS